MILAATAILLLMAVWIVARMLADAFNPDRDAVSMRNIFLLGFILFQLTSTAYTLQTGQMDYMKIVYLDEPGMIFALMALAFFILFSFFYSKGILAVRLATRRTVPHAASVGGLFAAAIGCVVVGLVFRYVLTQVPILGVLTAQMSVGALSAACGLVMWAWARDARNFMLLVSALAVVLFCCAILLSEAWSRREITTLFLATIWAGYWSRWRYGARTQLVTRGLSIGAVGFMVVLFLSASRTATSERFSLSDYLNKFAAVSPDRLQEAALGIANGQFAGANSLWVIENYPENFSYTPFHSIIYYVTNPIPRVLYPGKPDPLGTRMIKEAGVSKVAGEFSFGPGLIGHITTDFPFAALPIYAFLLALVFRFMDDRCRWWFNDPFIVVPIGCAATQVLAFSRGELGLFAFQATSSILGAWVAIKLVGRWFWYDDSASYQADPDPSDEDAEGMAPIVPSNPPAQGA